MHAFKSIVAAVIALGLGSSTTFCQESNTGELTGRFRLVGELPEPKESRFKSIRLDEPPARDSIGRISGVEMMYRRYLELDIRPDTSDHSLIVGEDGGITNVFVYAVKMPREAKHWERFESAEKPTTLSIERGNYSPRALAIHSDQKLRVQNLDETSFGFYMDSHANQQMRVRLQPSGSILIDFDHKEAFPIRFGSAQEAWAQGHLLIRDDPYFAITDSNGNFVIDKLPPGDWEFRAWHERTGYLPNHSGKRLKVQVSAGKNSLGTMDIPSSKFVSKE